MKTFLARNISWCNQKFWLICIQFKSSDPEKYFTLRLSLEYNSTKDLKKTSLKKFPLKIQYLKNNV